MSKLLTYKDLCKRAQEFKANKISEAQYLDSIAFFVMRKIENDVNNYIFYTMNYTKRR